GGLLEGEERPGERGPHVDVLRLAFQLEEKPVAVGDEEVDDDVLLAPEVAEEGPARDPGRGGDLIDRRLREAPLEEESHGCAHERLVRAPAGSLTQSGASLVLGPGVSAPLARHSGTR